MATRRAKKKAAPPPAGGAPRLDDPSDAEALAVYADWLQTKGDPRGELIALEQKGLREKADAFAAGHRKELLGSFAGVDPSVADVGWEYGFPRYVSLSWGAGAPGSDAVELIERLKKVPEIRFLRRLRVSGAEIDRLPAVDFPGLEQLELDNCTIEAIDPKLWDAASDACELRFQYCTMDFDALFEQLLVHGPGRWKVSVFELDEMGYRQTPRFKDVQALGNDFAGDREARGQLYRIAFGGAIEGVDLPKSAAPRHLAFLNHSRKAIRREALGWLEKTFPRPRLPGKGAKARVLGKPLYHTAAELTARIKKIGWTIARSVKEATVAVVLDVPGEDLAAAIAGKIPLVLEAQLKKGLEAAEGPAAAPTAEEAGGLEARLLSADVEEVKAAMRELRSKPIPKALLPAAFAVAFFHPDAAVRKDGREALVARADAKTAGWLKTLRSNTFAITDGVKMWKLTRELAGATGVDPMLFSRHLVRVFSRREDQLFRSDEPLSVALRFPENEPHVFGYYAAADELTLPPLKKSFPKGLGVLKALESLRISSGTVTSDENVEELATLPKLRTLEYWVRKADLRHLAPLKDTLRDLRVRGAFSELSDLSPLKTWTKLELLDVSNTSVADLSPLAGKASLRTLLIAETPVTDLSPLTTLTGLTYLSISKVKAAPSVVAKLTNLQTLDAGFTMLEDLSIVSGLKRLQDLRLWGVKVKDLSPLAALPLKSLSLTHVQPLPDLSPLASIATLKSLDLIGCNADPEKVLALKKKLPELYVSA